MQQGWLVMNYERTIIEKYKDKLGYKQDKQVIADLGISKSHFSEIKSGNRHLTDEQIVILCNNAGFNTVEELAKSHFETAKSPKVKQAWSELVKKISATAASLIVALALVGAPMKDAEPSFL